MAAVFKTHPIESSEKIKKGPQSGGTNKDYYVIYYVIKNHVTTFS